MDQEQRIAAQLAAGVLLAVCAGLGACGSPSASVDRPMAADSPAARGEALFRTSCAACHGEGGRGEAGRAPVLDASGHAWHHPDQQLGDWILNGKLGPDGAMPPNRDRITPEDVSALLAYLKSLWSEEQRATQADITRRYEEGLRRSR